MLLIKMIAAAAAEWGHGDVYFFLIESRWQICTAGQVSRFGYGKRMRNGASPNRLPPPFPSTKHSKWLANECNMRGRSDSFLRRRRRRRRRVAGFDRRVGRVAQLRRRRFDATGGGCGVGRSGRRWRDADGRSQRRRQAQAEQAQLVQTKAERPLRPQLGRQRR